MPDSEPNEPVYDEEDDAGDLPFQICGCRIGIKFLFDITLSFNIGGTPIEFAGIVKVNNEYTKTLQSTSDRERNPGAYYHNISTRNNFKGLNGRTHYMGLCNSRTGGWSTA